MAQPAKPVPEGYHTLTPYLTVRDAAKAIEFYKQAFGAKVRTLHNAPGGMIMHADLQIGDSILMLADDFMNTLPERTAEIRSPVTIHMYLDKVDAVFNRAVAAGATVVMPLADQFWGDRYGQLQDPFGHRWSLATRLRDMSEEEIVKAAQLAFAEMA